MDPRLFAAAQSGDVNELRVLIADNAFLFKPAELTRGYNPLHIACMAPHLDFVREVLHHDPGSAKELNADGVSPLHIASAYGYLDIVTELLVVGPHLCLVKAKNGKFPLHYAVVRGQIHVINQLLSACLDSIEQVTDEGETCFHVAVRYNQLEALRHLMVHVNSLNNFKKRHVLSRKDQQGNSILHLAAFREHYEVLDFLLLNMKPQHLYLNKLNKHHLTPLDVLISRGGRDETAENLQRAGAKHATKMSILWHRMRDRSGFVDILRTYNKLPHGTRELMLVVITVIVAATLQSVVNPPGGVWQETELEGPSNNTHYAGKSILATGDRVMFGIFLYLNSVGFMASTLLLMILTSSINTGGLFRLALIFLVFTYILCTVVITPNGHRRVSIVYVLLAVGFSLLSVIVLSPKYLL